MDGFWVPTNISNQVDSIFQDTPKFNNLTMGFTLHPSTDFKAGSSFGNPEIDDFGLQPVNDVASCMSECTQFNLYMPPHDSTTPPGCSGVVFFTGGSCWLKSGLKESSLSNADNNATAAVLHLFR